MQHIISKKWGLGAVFATLLASALLLQPAFTHADTAVSIGDNTFSPQAITVAPGDTITWTNNGTMQHTVTADDGSFSSVPLNPGDSYSHTFTATGTFPYYCSFHGGPGGVGMSGTVTVSDTDSSTSSSTSTTSTTTSTSTASTSGMPIVSAVVATPTDTSATITWTTDVVSDSQVSYGLTSMYTSTTTPSTEQSMSHSVLLSGLLPNTLYHFMVMSSAGGLMGMSSDQTFMTTGGTSTTPTSGTTTPSTVEDQINRLEAEIATLEAQIQSLITNGQGGYPPPPSDGGYAHEPMSSTESAAVYADYYAVQPGHEVTFSGSGFGAGEDVRISAGGDTVETAHTDSGGSFTKTITASYDTGDTTYWFTGENSGNSDSVMITVESSDSTVGNNP